MLVKGVDPRAVAQLVVQPVQGLGRLCKPVLRVVRGIEGGEVDDDEGEENMRKQLDEVNQGRKDPGRWELFTITVDSGAGESVSPPHEGTTFPIIETQASRDGIYYVAATGDRVYNEGERRITCTTPEGHQQSCMFQVAEVNKALASVSRICDSGRDRVVFQKGDSFIENMKSGRRTKLIERNGVYVLEAWIDKEAGFARPGATP